MADGYNFKQIEEKWKIHWYDDNLYEAVDFSPKPKKYILAELPYPSGKFLHIGHTMRYTVPDVYARFLRMNGYNVLYPMGWDSFGLPAETFAIKEKITPQQAIAQAVENFRDAMKRMGYSIDWKREINTSDPQFYKWTQWTFLKLWEKGLAEIKELPVWWCKELGVLADEEVLPALGGGKISERGSHAVQRVVFKQWVLKITKYADRLLEDLNKVDYTDSIKEAQRNWIGKRDGALIKFEINGEFVEAFTTRVDTLYGVTFLAISPRHPVIKKLHSSIQNMDEVNKYIEASDNMTDMEKQTKEKTGVKLVGVVAKHPFAGEPEVIKEIPVYLADYILLDYGTGVVMGVPAHDERDLAFATKYNLEIKQVINSKTPDSYGTLINSGKYNDKTSETATIEIIDELEKSGKGKKHATYKLRDQIFSRQRYWGEPIPLIYKQDGTIEADNNLPLELPIMKDFLPGENGSKPLERATDWVNTTDSQGNLAKRETDTMPTWAGSNWYYVGYVDPNNPNTLADKEKLKYWMPVDRYFGDAGHTTVHLLYSRFWYKFLYDIGVVPHDEPYKWRLSGGLLLGPDGHKMSKSRGNVINPIDVIENYGADALRVYLSFIGPYEDTYPWNDAGVKACYRLMNTISQLATKVSDTQPTPEQTKAYNVMVKKITTMCTDLKMNTAVSEIMKFVNIIKREKEVNKSMWIGFIKIIAPFAPFLAEQLWQDVNNYTEWNRENSVHLQEWPKFDEVLANEVITKVPVQIDGKVREQLEISGSETTEQIKIVVLAMENIKKHTDGKEIKNFLYIPNKIVSISTK